MEGCRFNSSQALHVGKDVWFVGHCIVSPIVAEDWSVALAGSVVTKDMKRNRVYAGSPAEDITGKIGAPYRSVTIEEKVEYLQNKQLEFFKQYPAFDPAAIGILAEGVVILPGESEFDVADRTYSKIRSEAEVAFMKFLLPLAKFTPRSPCSS